VECGFLPREIEDTLAGKHTYAEYRIFGELSLVLCNTCYVDFSSRDPAFFGVPSRPRIDIRRWEFVRDVEPVITKDKCCVKCGYRLPFLAFVAQARELHTESKGKS
jgi:hypothetical protein